jgi:hypothetical protein
VQASILEVADWKAEMVHWMWKAGIASFQFHSMSFGRLDSRMMAERPIALTSKVGLGSACLTVLKDWIPCYEERVLSVVQEAAVGMAFGHQKTGLADHLESQKVAVLVFQA